MDKKQANISFGSELLPSPHGEGLEVFYLLFHGQRLFLCQDEDGRWLLPDRMHGTAVTHGETFHLQTAEGTPCIIQAVEEDTLPHLQLWDLREAYGVMPAELHAIASKGAELLYWDTHTRFCGKCGAPMARSTEISKCCTACGEEVWPCVQTAIIVLIERTAANGTNEVLLVRAKNFRRPFHGLVAGFVETGESLEACVRREVGEETGISIRDLRYAGSQPWPYPFGLMVGFRARYEGGELCLKDGELAHADWYKADNLPELPPPPSIARRLIDAWTKEQKNGEGHKS